MEENKIKTVVDVIKRDDYTRMTKELKTKAEALAEIIKRKMLELGIYELIVNKVKYKILRLKDSQFKEYTYFSVAKKTEYDYIDKSNWLDIYGYTEQRYEFYNLENLTCDYYFNSNSKYHIVGASNKDALRFINSAKEFIQTLGEIEEEQVNEVNKALAIADEIINK